MNPPTKVLIVDDSSLYRKILTNAVEGLPIPTEISTAPSGTIALKKAAADVPDIVLMDIEMPDMNGVEVTKVFRRDFPKAIVVLVSGANSRSADITVEGLLSGATNFVSKPTGSDLAQNVQELQRALDQVFSIAMARQNRQTGASPLPAKPAPRVGSPSLLPSRVDLVAIGVSTGGPNALETVLSMLPASFRVPIAIVQHMPPMFTASLARSLNGKTGLRVVEAQADEKLLPNSVYIAPGGIHMLIKRERGGGDGGLVVALDDGPPVNSCKPAVDKLFQSVAQATARHTLAIVMTGMGSDGAAGVAAIKGASGYCLTQSAETCTVYGMPKAVDAANLSDESVPLEAIASRIVAIAGGA